MSSPSHVGLVALSAMLLVGCVNQSERYAYLTRPPTPSYTSPSPGIPLAAASPAATLATVAPAAGPNAAPPGWQLHAAPPPPPAAAPTAVAPPSAAQPQAAAAFALPPLTLPRHEAWSSARCTELSVTFSGPPKTVEIGIAESASYEEARQYREGDYEETAECFCAKSGDLSTTDKITADAVMAQTAKQIAEASHMRVRRIAFAEDGPLGKYSEIEATSPPPAQKMLLLRTYWHGQCSMRVATLSTAESEARAAQFLDSLHAVNEAVKEPAEAAAPKPAATSEAAPPAAADAATPAAKPQPAASSTVAGQDFGAMVKRRAKEIRDGVTPASQEVSAEAAPETKDDPATLSPDASARLQQLQQLRDRGLITRAEYLRKRNAIIDGL